MPQRVPKLTILDTGADEDGNQVDRSVLETPEVITEKVRDEVIPMSKTGNTEGGGETAETTKEEGT